MMKTQCLKIALVLQLFLLILARAEVSLEVLTDELQISEEDNFTFQIQILSDEGSVDVERPNFKAPDFEEVNAHVSASSQISIVNGQRSNTFTKTFTFVLHPNKSGQHSITNISARVGSQLLKGRDISVVVQSGSGNVRSRNNSQYASPSQLPRSGVLNQKQKGQQILIRAELDKQKVYKGQQVLLTYAIYTRVQLMSVVAERYPNIAGTIKEDIDLPILRQPLHLSPSVINGTQYYRGVLAQYALYPVQEGKIAIEPFTAKVTYQAIARNRFDDEDNFGGLLNSFFGSFNTQAETRTSDKPILEVMPLPADGQPAGFTGLVGDFSITTVVDKTTLKAGDPLNVKIKVEGEGHVGSLEQLPVTWPQDFEQFENKAQTTFHKTGQSEKLFEFLLVPKAKGKFEIPSIQLSMFNPQTGRYENKKSEPISIEVLEGNASNTYSPKNSVDVVPKTPTADIQYWKSTDTVPSKDWFVIIVGILFVIIAVVFSALGIRLLVTTRGVSQAKKFSKAVKQLQLRVKAVTELGSLSLGTLAEIEQIMADLLRIRFDISTGSSLRSEIRDGLKEKQVPAEVANRVERLLELCENARYAPGAMNQTFEGPAKTATRELGELFEKLYPRD